MKKFNIQGNGYNYPDPDQNQVNFRDNSLERDRYGRDREGRDREGRFNDYRDLDQDSGRPAKTKPSTSLAQYLDTNNQLPPQHVKQEESYVDDSDAFFNSLRDGDRNDRKSSNRKGSWNNDFTAESPLDGPPRRLAPKPLSKYSNSNSNNNGNDNGNSKSTPRKQVRNERIDAGDWNFDTTVLAPTPSKEANATSQRGKGDLVHARSRLSLLKSKLRKSDDAPPTPDHSTYSHQYLRTQSVEQPFRDIPNLSQQRGVERKGVKSQHAPRRDYQQENFDNYDNYEHSQAPLPQQSHGGRGDRERQRNEEWQYGYDSREQGMRGREDLFQREAQSQRIALRKSQPRGSDRGFFDDRQQFDTVSSKFHFYFYFNKFI